MARPLPKSKYVHYLPAVMRTDEFLGRFLFIFQEVLDGVEDLLAQIHDYFDPLLAPERLLPFLASWVDLKFEPGWPVEMRRRLVREALELYRWRGTKRGLQKYIELYTGAVPEIEEEMASMCLGPGASLGWNTVLGGGKNYNFTVTIHTTRPEEVELDVLRAIIEREKPAFCTYELRVVAADSGTDKEDTHGTHRPVEDPA
jgi:phage tail-like protein